MEVKLVARTYRRFSCFLPIIATFLSSIADAKRFGSCRAIGAFASRH
jgi:hypothetical protein